MPLAKLIFRYLLGLFFIAAGVNHFRSTAFYESIVPPGLPWPSAIVAVSGVAEIVLGAAVLWPAWQGVAGWGLIGLLVAVFPANVYMAMHPERFAMFRPGVLWARLPMQGVLIAWAWWCTRAG